MSHYPHDQADYMVQHPKRQPLSELLAKVCGQHFAPISTLEIFNYDKL
jgi:hypothetical protein